MNEIETIFYNCYIENIDSEIECQKPIGIYKPDFVINNNIIIEIDGHEYHKTKEQRYHDYKRERFFQKLNYIVIRFTGTEVFLNVEDCVYEAKEIIEKYYEKLLSCYEYRIGEK